jgi:hypothetical protein
VLTAWSILFDCQSAEEAELAAFDQLKGYVWLPVVPLPIILESDNSTCINSLTSGAVDRSSLAPFIQDAKEARST